MSRQPVVTPRGDDFPRWYQDVIAKAELAENGPVRGSMVIRPAGYALWERMQGEVDARIKAAGAQNAYFPLLIPESYLRREAEHVEGFSPELAVVTIGGGKQLEEPLVVRPTSETVIGEYMAKWVQSYRDLPLLLNQWANVLRWELRPRLFLRTTEFLWQEGHTAHATEEDARAYARRILHEVYEDFMVGVLGIPVTAGRKTARERFAGATSTYTLEAMMGDGKALQMGTSHELGQNFAKAFGIEYSSVRGTREHAWTTSWGSTTRMIGGMVMVHGDDGGLRVPPLLAPTQVLVCVVKDGDGVHDAARRLVEEIERAGVRVALDTRTDTPFGRRAVDAELKGFPLRIEIGPRDLGEGRVVLVRRLDGSKTPTPIDAVTDRVTEMLSADQRGLYEAAREHRDARTVEVKTLDEAVEVAATGWARVPWAAVGTAGETRLNAQGLTVRCLVRADGGVPDSEDEPDLVALVARAY
ncbi:proline--tRNA ligase [Virgisporangium aliadipatigenens]|uniref:Proline--tRNA ligase n=1 Tax=Virgisporangium aliadipatigenens TaxID=741659 RepID=A0A8J4DNZ3_9ACTN|nr:proline--tRNA ligase [Virgisporangium aliadipatigenens]GIJ43977.1 proline--tRNA ligase [Virgisporangium aliadipatigenens]